MNLPSDRPPAGLKEEEGKHQVTSDLTVHSQQIKERSGRNPEGKMEDAPTCSDVIEGGQHAQHERRRSEACR
ncbi:hypothetical protein COCON_G00200530 [Conger conger]|uniref:Uncharacterized protein n=1 Tax=Conger conger TaxID=82655 RepID=A0A9Q1HR81_CONCO|nr:hypothetical protein COCON_G00200530 [Conger conger]